MKHARFPMADPNQTPQRGDWLCPCNGCAKAVKQERKRILAALEAIDVDSPAQLNAVGFKMIIKEIVENKS